jgi:hypothetical protein
LASGLSSDLPLNVGHVLVHVRTGADGGNVRPRRQQELEIIMTKIVLSLILGVATVGSVPVSASEKDMKVKDRCVFQEDSPVAATGIAACQNGGVCC